MIRIIPKHIPQKYIIVLAVVLLNAMLLLNANANPVTREIRDVEKRLGARVGVAVYDTASNDLWHYNGDARFPLNSTFKTLACAKLLADVDKGNQSFDSNVVIQRNALVTWSPVTEKLVGKALSLGQACEAVMVMSDNTAANIVLGGIGGPEALTQFMRAMGDRVTRLDRIEPDLGEAAEGDPRDTTTPKAMVKSLHTLLFGNTVLNAASQKQLKQWMMDNEVSDSLLRSVLPGGWSIADRSGAGGNGSRGITAVAWSRTRLPLVISIYLTRTDASFDARNQAIAGIGRAIFDVYH